MSDKRLEELLASVADAAWIEKTNFGLETLLLERLLPILEAGQAMRDAIEPWELLLKDDVNGILGNRWDAAIGAGKE
jgi:hypothetical protein